MGFAHQEEAYGGHAAMETVLGWIPRSTGKEPFDPHGSHDGLPNNPGEITEGILPAYDGLEIKMLTPFPKLTLKRNMGRLWSGSATALLGGIFFLS